MPAVSAAMARRAIGWFLMLFTLGLVGCDHATKVVAQTTLESRGPLSLIPGLLGLRYAENHDTAFSLLRSLDFPGKAALLFVLSATILGFVLVTWWRRRRSSTAEQVGYALVVAGAVGNALDRARRGFVVDFIEIHRWPVFNVADMAIVAGVILLAIVLYRRSRDEAMRAPPA